MSTKEQRLTICRACPHLFRLTGQCKVCGCFVRIKTAIASQKCPKGKW